MYLLYNTNLIDRVKRRKPVQNITKHASCLQQGAKVILQKMWQSNSLFVLNRKCYVGGKSNTLLSTTIHIVKQWWLHHVMGMLVIVKDWEVFQDKK